MAKYKTVKEQRELVQRVEKYATRRGCGLTMACNALNISYSTYYKFREMHFGKNEGHGRKH